MEVMDVSRFTSIGIGVKAKVLVARSRSDLMDIDGYILGGGSNVLICSALKNRSFVINRALGIEKSGTLVYANSGEKTSMLVSFALKNNLSGLEWAYGLPGTVGGAIAGNAGAYGGSVSSVLLYADVMENGKFVRKSRKECRFSYRRSGISGVILGGCFMLSRDSRENILRRTAIVKAKRRAQPKGKSAGCSFRNPDGDSAGRLIEACGLKGHREGGAVISPLHANFIINDGNASAKDVLTLLNLSERAVFDRFGIRLEREIRIIGEE